MEQIVLKNVTKTYNNKCVLEDISQTFMCGHSYAFSGHNGYGKSTLLRLISGITRPEKGKVVYSKKFSFSFVPEKFRPTALSGRIFLERMGEIDGLTKTQLSSRINQFAESFYMSDMLDIPMKKMSKGTLQKIGIIQALLKEPDILLLDEPLSGQDMASQKVFSNRINELRDKGVTVFMACHESWLVDTSADTVFTIENRQLVPRLEIQKRIYKLLLEKTESAAVREDMKLCNGV